MALTKQEKVADNLKCNYRFLAQLHKMYESDIIEIMPEISQAITKLMGQRISLLKKQKEITKSEQKEK